MKIEGISNKFNLFENTKKIQDVENQKSTQAKTITTFSAFLNADISNCTCSSIGGDDEEGLILER